MPLLRITRVSKCYVIDMEEKEVLVESLSINKLSIVYLEYSAVEGANVINNPYITFDFPQGTFQCGNIDRWKEAKLILCEEKEIKEIPFSWDYQCKTVYTPRFFLDLLGSETNLQEEDFELHSYWKLSRDNWRHIQKKEDLNIDKRKEFYSDENYDEDFYGSEGFFVEEDEECFTDEELDNMIEFFQSSVQKEGNFIWENAYHESITDEMVTLELISKGYCGKQQRFLARFYEEQEKELGNFLGLDNTFLLKTVAFNFPKNLYIDEPYEKYDFDYSLRCVKEMFCNKVSQFKTLEDCMQAIMKLLEELVETRIHANDLFEVICIFKDVTTNKEYKVRILEITQAGKKRYDWCFLQIDEKLYEVLKEEEIGEFIVQSISNMFEDYNAISCLFDIEAVKKANNIHILYE